MRQHFSPETATEQSKPPQLSFAMDFHQAIQKAQLLASQNRLQEASELSKVICEQFPDNAKTWQFKGLLEGQLGNLPAAELSFGQAIRLSPYDTQIANNYVNSLTGQNKFNEAHKFLTHALQSKILSPQPETIQLLADIDVMRGDFSSAITQYKKLLASSPTNTTLLFKIGNAYAQSQHFDSAIESYNKCIEIEPKFAAAFNALGILYQTQDDMDKAEPCYQQAIKIDPDNPIYLYNLGSLYRKTSADDDAIIWLNKALEINPNYPEALNTLGLAYHGVFAYQKAVDCYNKALSIIPNYVDALYNKGHALYWLGDYDEALANYSMTLDIDANLLDAKIGTGEVLEKLGRHKEAYELLDPLVTTNTSNSQAAGAYGTVCRRLRKQAEAAPRIEEIIKNGTNEGLDMSIAHFALGDIYDDLHDYDNAFKHYFAANDASHFTFSPEENTQYFDSIKSTFNKDEFKSLQRSSTTDLRPIFIVGMPRSGTSLVEQILDTHPSVTGAGELTHIGHIAGNVGRHTPEGSAYPQCVSQLSREIIEEFSSYYSDCINEYSSSSRYIVDKMPHNFLELGLISLLFPNAKIIHCTRDPRDTCLSVYFHNFNHNHPYAVDLENLGLYYLEYLSLMQHWDTNLPLRIFTINYEELTSNPESNIRDMLSYLELPWHPECMEFHRNKRTVVTPSYAQVNKPIYKSSQKRWKAYEDHIGKLTRVLPPR